MAGSDIVVQVVLIFSDTMTEFEADLEEIVRTYDRSKMESNLRSLVDLDNPVINWKWMTVDYGK